MLRWYMISVDVSYFNIKNVNKIVYSLEYKVYSRQNVCMWSPFVIIIKCLTWNRHWRPWPSILLCHPRLSWTGCSLALCELPIHWGCPHTFVVCVLYFSSLQSFLLRWDVLSSLLYRCAQRISSVFFVLYWGVIFSSLSYYTFSIKRQFLISYS